MYVCTCRCDELVKVFVEDPSPEARLLVGGDMRKIQLCFTLLKVNTHTHTHTHYHNLCTMQARVKTTPAPFLPPPSSSPNTHSQTLSGDNKQMTSDPMTSELKKLIRQKDEEIIIPPSPYIMCPVYGGVLNSEVS